MKSSKKIEKMFDEISVKYDFMNNLISLFTHSLIKRFTINKLELKKKSKVIDLCCGTGDITRILAQKKEVKKVIGVDFSQGMLNIAKEKNKSEKVTFLKENCISLSFPNKEFDCATMFFGLRNVEDENKVLAEIKRILKKDGQFLYMDFMSENKVLNNFLDFLILFFAKIFSKNNKKAYEYLVKSKNSFYCRNELVTLIQKKGFELEKEYKLLFSTILVHFYKI